MKLSADIFSEYSSNILNASNACDLCSVYIKGLCYIWRELYHTRQVISIVCISVVYFATRLDPSYREHFGMTPAVGDLQAVELLSACVCICVMLPVVKSVFAVALNHCKRRIPG